MKINLFGFHLFFFLGLLVSSLSRGLMQSCPSSEVGSTETNMIEHRNPREGHVYLNLDEVAECNGTVYGWRYCFDPDDDEENELVLAMYRPQKNGIYQLISGSYYELSLEYFESFTCRNITLTPSERFTVKQNDVVAFCEEIGTFRVEVFFSKPGGKVSHWNAGGCSESNIRVSNTLSQSNNRVFLLKAFIDVNECDGGIHNCHENATCSDIVGGFKCTCKSGFTGNGTFCESINECDGGIHNCHENSTCSDIVGGFNCVCDAGFIGNGTFCESNVLLQHEFNSWVTVYVAVSTVAVLIAVFTVIIVIVLSIKKYRRKGISSSNQHHDNTEFHEPKAQPTQHNDTFVVTGAHEPTAQHNQAYGIAGAYAQPNEAYDIAGARELTFQPNDAYDILASHELTVESYT